MGCNIAVGQNSSEILQFEDSWFKLDINYFLFLFFCIITSYSLILNCNKSELFPPTEMLHPILETLATGESFKIEVTKINQE